MNKFLVIALLVAVANCGKPAENNGHGNNHRRHGSDSANATCVCPAPVSDEQAKCVETFLGVVTVTNGPHPCRKRATCWNVAVVESWSAKVNGTQPAMIATPHIGEGCALQLTNGTDYLVALSSSFYNKNIMVGNHCSLVQDWTAMPQETRDATKARFDAVACSV